MIVYPNRYGLKDIHLFFSNMVTSYEERRKILNGPLTINNYRNICGGLFSPYLKFQHRDELPYRLADNEIYVVTQYISTANEKYPYDFCHCNGGLLGIAAPNRSEFNILISDEMLVMIKLSYTEEQIISWFKIFNPAFAQYVCNLMSQDYYKQYSSSHCEIGLSSTFKAMLRRMPMRYASNEIIDLIYQTI